MTSLSSTDQGALIFSGIIAVVFIIFGIIGFLQGEMHMPIGIRLFYVIRIPLGRIDLSGPAAIIFSTTLLIPGLLLGMAAILFWLKKVSFSGEILLGLAFLAFFFALIGLVLGLIVQPFTRKRDRS